MESRSLLKYIFEKERGIQVKDLEQKIINKFKENDFFECKTIKARQDKENGILSDSIRNLIMQELVAFLNKLHHQGGVLALGIDAKEKNPTKICGVEEKYIKNESSLRDWIINDLSSIPSWLEFPSLEIEPIDIADKNKVYLIEVHPKDTDVLYFTKTSNNAYKREVDTTRLIPLEETIRIIENKRISKLFVSLEEIKLEIKNDFVFRKLKIVYMNIGSKPSFYVTSMFLFNPKDSIYTGKYIEVSIPNMFETTSFNKCLKAYKKNFSEPFYPSRPFVDSFIDLKFKRDEPINLIVEIDEEKGRSKQIFSIDEHGISETEKTFFSYIS